MEAKDTYIIACENERSITECPIYVQRLVHDQAKISFKAGIKEVVEWIKLHWISRSYHQDGTYEFLISEWEAKLKEWGIDG